MTVHNTTDTTPRRKRSDTITDLEEFKFRYLEEDRPRGQAVEYSSYPIDYFIDWRCKQEDAAWLDTNS